MPRRARHNRTDQASPEELDEYEEYQLEEDHFVDDLRAAFARAHSSHSGGFDMREDARGSGFDVIGLDFND